MNASSVDVPVALLGYGTVGSAVERLLETSADEIERATGHRLRVVRALVRDPAKERPSPAREGVLTDDFAAIRDDPEIAVVAEVMGGIEPAGEYVHELLRRGKPVVTANKQLVAREGAELFATASKAGVQLRFEASVCAAIPVVKVLREALVATTVHRILGIVNGTTNFVLTEMEGGRSYAEALAEAQRLGFAEADPTDDVTGADAAAKMAILATVAFGSRVTPPHVETTGIEGLDEAHFRAARELDAVVRLIGSATLVDGRVDVRVQPALVGRHHPLAAVEGPFNAVMLNGDAIREIVARGAGGRRDRDGVGGRLRPRQRGRDDRDRVPPERRVLARAAAARAGRLPRAVLPPARRRRPPGRPRRGGGAPRRAGGVGRAAPPGAGRGRGDAPRRHAHGAARRDPRGARGDRGGAGDARARRPCCSVVSDAGRAAA